MDYIYPIKNPGGVQLTVYISPIYHTPYILCEYKSMWGEIILTIYNCLLDLQYDILYEVLKI